LGDEPKISKATKKDTLTRKKSRAQKAAAAVELKIEDEEDEDKEDEVVEEDSSLFVPMPFRRHRLCVLRHAISSTLLV
jgi:hypothetical protein